MKPAYFFITAVLLLAVLAAGCTVTTETSEWSEEVAQSDGSVLRLLRKTTRSAWGGLRVKKGTVLGFSLRYAPWGLTWESEPGSPSEPVAFEIIEGQPILVVFDEGGRHCGSKHPQAFAAQFLLGTPSGWIEFEPEPDLLQALHKNLYESYWSPPESNVESGHMTLALKKFRERGTDYMPLVEWFAVPGRSCGVFQ